MDVVVEDIYTKGRDVMTKEYLRYLRPIVILWNGYIIYL